MFRPNQLKASLRNGKRSFGIWLQSGCPTFAEIAALAGFDFFIMDQEHGSGGLREAVDGMRAAACAPATAVIRVQSSDPTYLRRLVDAGIEGILVPMVDSARQAREIVEACRFPPRGRRGNAADITRSSNFGLIPDYLDRADDNLLIAVQIETAAAVQNAGEIAEVEGVDLVFIGPNDLSGSIGLAGRTGAPEVEAAIAEVMAAARAAGKPLGTVPRDGKTWQALFDEGFSLIATGSDIYFFRKGAADLVADWNAWSQRPKV